MFQGHWFRADITKTYKILEWIIKLSNWKWAEDEVVSRCGELGQGIISLDWVNLGVCLCVYSNVERLKSLIIPGIKHHWRCHSYWKSIFCELIRSFSKKNPVLIIRLPNIYQTTVIVSGHDKQIITQIFIIKSKSRMKTWGVGNG